MKLKDIQQMLIEKKLTKAELKKREEIAQAMERENPGMGSTPEGMAKKMAIATAQAKKIAEDIEELDEDSMYNLVVDFYREKGLDPYKLRGKTGSVLRDKIKSSPIFQAWLRLRRSRMNSSYEYEKNYTHIIETLKDAKKQSKGKSKNDVIFFSYPDSSANTESDTDKNIAHTDNNFISPNKDI